MTIRPVQPADAADWARMRHQLWPAPEGEHAGEIADYFAGNRRHLVEALLAIDDRGRAIGFAELGIRAYAEGCYSGRVAFLEGWYVAEASRCHGVGAALVKAAEDWATAQGCTEFASDTHPDNATSLAAHRALGFEETERLVCFRKSL